MARTDPRHAAALLGIVLLSWSYAASCEEESESVLAVDSGERKPVLTVVPVYPELALRRRVEGDVQVCFNVDQEGIPHRVRVRSSSNRVFEKPAVLAARASTWEPLLPGTKPSGIKTCRTFRFRLSPGTSDRSR